jgi:aspartyl-tRNA(Asn)/glutamyl-tRNA(Gln) amidotransferase subunit C
MNIKDVENLAELAKIELSPAEKEGLLKDLDSILDYIKQVEGVEIKNSEIEYKNTNIWREDELKPRNFSSDIIKKQFPDSKDGFVKVKKIL